MQKPWASQHWQTMSEQQDFNTDETGFLKKLTSNDRNYSQVQGSRRQSELTRLLCANVLGAFLVKSMLVYRPLHPQALKVKKKKKNCQYNGS
jgi:hypothetical protein